VNIYINISIEILIPLESPVLTVQQAILNYAAGIVDNVEGLGVGKNVSPFELSGAVTIQYPGIYVQDCQISLDSGSGFAAAEIPIEKWEIANIQQGFINVTLLPLD
jgi:hypothetical protein